jgi:hypothetical protein
MSAKLSFKSISLHPKFAGFLDVFVGLIFLLSLNKMSVWWILLIAVGVRLFWWMILLRLVYYPPNLKRFWHLLTLVVFHLGTVILLLFVEWKISWYLVGVIYLVFPLVSFFLLPSKSASQLSFVLKPYRRWRFWMNLFGLYGIWAGVYAAISLQILNVSYWTPLVTASLATAIISAWWWQEYQIEKNSRFWWWVLGIGILILEVSWVLFRWPLGYFTNDLILIWLWYDIWLLARFHLVPAGINWRKQNLFFIINGVLLLSFLILIVKWK